MSNNIEWAYVKDTYAHLLGPDDEADDGNTPAGEIDGSDESKNIALVVEGCALYGEPAHLLEFFSDAIAKISAHLAGQN